MSLFENVEKGWSFVQAAFRMARENRALLLPSLLQVAITVVIVVAWIAALVSSRVHHLSGGWALAGALSGFGAILAYYFFCGVTVNMIDVHLKGGTPSLRNGARDAAKNFVAIVYLSLVSLVVNVVSSSARDRDSFVGRLVAGIVDSLWTTLASLLLPAIIIEDAGLSNAMKRVRALHKGNMLMVGIGELGVRAITNLIGLVWFLLTFGVVWLAVSSLGRTAALVVGLGAGGTMIALYSAFSTYLRMAYYTCLYLWAVDVEEKGKSAPAPLPLAIALGHARHAASRS